jgi:hypothetical protein
MVSCRLLPIVLRTVTMAKGGEWPCGNYGTLKPLACPSCVLRKVPLLSHYYSTLALDVPFYLPTFP